MTTPRVWQGWRGINQGDEIHVEVFEDGGRQLNHVRLHAKEFDWGANGKDAGCIDLSVSMLCDFFRMVATATDFKDPSDDSLEIKILRVYSDFDREVVRKFEDNMWQLHERYVEMWVSLRFKELGFHDPRFDQA